MGGRSVMSNATERTVRAHGSEAPGDGRPGVAERASGPPDRPAVPADETTLRLGGLTAAVEAARGRVNDALLDEAAEVVSRGRHRLGLSSDHTIVALAGATGSGKSSLFNALCDLDLAAVGLKRPTTSWALACAWSSDGASEILEWLGIPRRHQVNRTGLLDETVADRDLHGLVLLDLPDHDSTEVSHHLEVERLVELADVLVWVLDPQKYADAVMHDRYLRPLSAHVDVMLVVLNHVDEIPPGGVEPCLLDVRRLLELDGLGDVPMVATSATEGEGIGELRQILAAKVSDKKSARERVDADVVGVARRLDWHTDSAQAVDIGADAHNRLLAACVDSAGVPVIVGALESTASIQARRATAWPVTKWLGRLRADPMSRLPDPDTSATQPAVPVAGGEEVSADGTLPATLGAHASGASGVNVGAAVRSVVDEVTAQMGRPWQQAAREACTERLDEFAHSLGSTFSSADMSATGDLGWWRLVRGLQWFLLMAAVAGGLWLLALVSLNASRERSVTAPHVGGSSLPLILLISGLVLGLLTGVVGGRLAEAWARRRAADADGRLRAGVARQADEFVLGPLAAELDAYRRSQAGLRTALAGSETPSAALDR